MELSSRCLGECSTSSGSRSILDSRCRGPRTPRFPLPTAMPPSHSHHAAPQRLSSRAPSQLSGSGLRSTQLRTRPRPCHCSAQIEPDQGPRYSAEMGSNAQIAELASRLRLRKGRAAGFPRVDWSRYHLQLCFVDRTDTVRARLAVGLFERIAEWNGYGRALYPHAVGVDARPGRPADPSTTMALLAQAGRLGIRPKLFVPGGERFEAEDLDRNDLIVTLDPGIQRDVLALAGGPSDAAFYAPRVCLLPAFSSYCPPALMLRPGGSAILDADMRRLVEPATARLASAGAGGLAEIVRPALSRAGPAEWDPVVQALVASCAGLLQYLMDSYPPDLPHYDPL